MKEARSKGIAVRVCIAALALTMLMAAFVLTAQAKETSKKIKIGVMQIVEHPSLDAARKGFVDSLAEAGYVEGKNVIYDFQNAQGDMSIAQSIAQKFVNDKVDMILAIATPTAQAAAQATDKIPILITAVTDPKAAGLVKSIEKSGTNVTGTSDLNPVAQQVELVLKFAPKAKRVGIIYNAGETNSLVQVDLAEKAAKALKLNLVKVTCSNSSGVYEAAQSLVGRVDAIYVPTDNTVVSALESVIKVAEQAKLPLIVGEGDSVKRGGLATVGINYYELGKQTGRMALKVIKGANPADMPIEYLAGKAELTINLKAAKSMGVKVPESLIKEADHVIK
ncbi:MAG TPA: ABC transporter substrate-binding protein [Firmicutes bacterium]|nr:ABC transporter substrate-binding protein [Bacillota bacterium]